MLKIKATVSGFAASVTVSAPSSYMRTCLESWPSTGKMGAIYESNSNFNEEFGQK